MRPATTGKGCGENRGGCGSGLGSGRGHWAVKSVQRRSLMLGRLARGRAMYSKMRRTRNRCVSLFISYALFTLGKDVQRQWIVIKLHPVGAQ